MNGKSILSVLFELLFIKGVRKLQSGSSHREADGYV
jgi:hypothetical protein